MENNRIEILKYLQNISPSVELVVLPSEGAIECTYVSKDGYSYEWRGIDDWPALSVTSFKEFDINELKESISRMDSNLSNVECSILGRIYNAFAAEPEESKLLKEIYIDEMKINGSNDYVLYAINITGCDDPRIALCTSYEVFEKIFYECYFSVTTKWDELSTDELLEWKQRIKEEIDGIPALTLKKDAGIND